MSSRVRLFSLERISLVENKLAKDMIEGKVPTAAGEIRSNRKKKFLGKARHKKARLKSQAHRSKKRSDEISL